MQYSRKQYVLSSSKLLLDGMEELCLQNAYLYVDKALKYQTAFSDDGKEVILLGHAYCVDQKGKNPVDDIINCEAEELIDISRNWTGRWAMILCNRLITDATCLMNVFYYQNMSQWVLSSSLALMSQIAGKEIKEDVNLSGLTWQLLPYSLLDGVKTLICTQNLIWGKEGLKVIFCNRFEERTFLTTKEKSNRIATMLQNALWNINQSSNKNITIALTSGKDSRLTLSAAIASGIPFNSYTAIHDRISHSDRTLPVRISKKFGFKHQIMEPDKTNNAKAADFLNFCGHNSKGADMSFYANGQFDGFSSDDIIIRSGIFEAAQHYGRSIMTDATLEALEEGVRKYYSSDISKKQDKALKEWIAYAKENPIPFVDVRDRFYIEQRVNGWVAAIEQAMDINDFTSIQIANCSELISVLLSATDEERSNLSLSFEPIKLMTPGLMEFPVNKRLLRDTFRIYKNGIIKRINKILQCK